MDRMDKLCQWIESVKTTYARGKKFTDICPICGKPIHFCIVQSNGHIAAKCSTKGCVQVIE